MNWSENVGKISKHQEKFDGFLWEIPNCFAYYSESVYKNGLIVSSPYFYHHDVEWRLALIQNKTNTGHEYTGLFLWKSPSARSSSCLNVCLGLNSYYIRGETDITGCFGQWKYMSRDALIGNKDVYSPTGMLRFFCEISRPKVVDPIPQGSLENVDKDVSENTNDGSENKTKEEISEAKGLDRLVQNLKNLLIDGQSSDVTLKVEDCEFKVHRIILMVRSPVFASMFKNDTKESLTGIVDIPDCSAEAIQIFLSYIYTGSADAISSNNVLDLYYVADKYQTNDLKLDCVEFMEKNLSVENFCDVITLSLQHSESGLKDLATRFFCENVKAIIKTIRWQKYLKDYPTQANELYIKAINA